MIGKQVELINYLLAQDKEKQFELKEYKEKRSLNANAYAWSLITKIADVLRRSKEEVYIAELQKYGQSQIVSVRSDINVSGFFKYYTEAGRSDLNGTEFTHYRVYKGSSEYNTKEMSVLIDGIVDDAKELEIETLTHDELERIKTQWVNQ